MNDFTSDLSKALKYAVDEKAAFESAIDQNPLDTTTHLVYADWLDENGEPEEAAFRRHMGKVVRGIDQDKNGRPSGSGWFIHRSDIPEGVDPNAVYHALPANPAEGMGFSGGYRFDTYRRMESAFRKAFAAGRKPPPSE